MGCEMQPHYAEIARASMGPPLKAAENAQHHEPFRYRIYELQWGRR